MNAGSRNSRAIAVATLDIPLELRALEDEGSCYDDDLWDDWHDDADDWPDWFAGGPREPLESTYESDESWYDDLDLYDFRDWDQLMQIAEEATALPVSDP